jgi:hypothetical protein
MKSGLCYFTLEVLKRFFDLSNLSWGEFLDLVVPRFTSAIAVL